MDDRGHTFSTLQHLLQLSYSENPEEQQKAAVELSRLVDGTMFPAVSFGPLAHALSRLLPNSNRTVASYSARALKVLILDDSLRPQAVVAGVPAVVCSAIRQWEDEVLCLRELLGALQTLCWDKQCAKGVLQSDIVSNLLEYVQAPDQEVSVLALATIANMLAYADTLLLSDTVVIETFGAGIPLLIEILRTSSSVALQQRPQRLYAAAAIANASAHPRLSSIINQNGGVPLCRELERQSAANLHIVGSKLGECAQTAIYRLSDRKEGDPSSGNTKYRFKWGTKPVMEISMAGITKHRTFMWMCLTLWLIVILYTFTPLVFS